MESNLSFFSLPFIDNADVDFTLPSHSSLLGADDVLAQFLSGDELLEEPDLSGPTTLHCEICRKQFDNVKKYYGHLRVHSKDNLWICEKCPNQKFSTKLQLMKHSVSHKPLERVWKCPQCDMSFEALWRLQQHLFAKHSDYRPHKCDRCDMSFHKQSDLEKHKDIHDDVKKHACKLCKSRFNDASNLKRHMVSHTNEKRYPCPGCGNRFAQLSSMKRHSKNCALVKPETGPVDKSIRKNYCRVCGMTFQYKSALLEHCVRQHSINPPPTESTNENKSEIHVDTHTNQQLMGTHIDTTHTNINTNLVNTNANLHSQNQIINIETNNQSNLHTQLNMHTNAMNIDIHSINMNTNTINNDTNINLNTNSAMNIQVNSSVNMNTMPTVNINTHSTINMERNQTVENIVDDILSAEDDYLIRAPMSNQLLNYNQLEAENHDNLINQIGLLKEMNQMHMLDDELLCNDLDFDSFQTMCNTNDMDYTDRNELLFDIPDGRSIDQDIMNALYQVRGDIPDLLNEPEMLSTTEKVNDFLTNPGVSVNECATIFESDVDLEASTNLAANLNQLIGENSVQYISTEHDDTFIISLNSEIDAEQLTDMLNIGVVPEEENKIVQETSKEEQGKIEPPPIVLTIENLPESVDVSKSSEQTSISVKIQPVIETEIVPEIPQGTKKKVKIKNRVLYVCRKCNKVFNKKDNYKSHRATHEPSLRRHVCRVCGERFSYRSTLNKHARLHAPRVAPAHACQRCPRTYQAAWMLKRHIAREHEFTLPFKCKEKDCGKRFYKQVDLDVHSRFHRDERPYSCEICKRSFFLMSHLKRHMKKVDCTKQAKSETLSNKSIKTPFSNILIIN